MRDIQILIMPLQDGFRAVGNEFAPVDTYSLAGFRRVLAGAIDSRFADPVRIELLLSLELRRSYPLCGGCHGAGEVSIPEAGAQYLDISVGTLDFTISSATTCQRCEGTGVNIPGF